MSDSRSIIFGVVPDEISAWNPEGDRDERERKQRSGHDGTAARELRERRHLQDRIHHDDADDQERDRPDLHERAQVVARREQQPHRQHGRDEPVARHQENELRPVEQEIVRE
jgi:hypothetical protein